MGPGTVPPADRDRATLTARRGTPPAPAVPAAPAARADTGAGSGRPPERAPHPLVARAAASRALAPLRRRVVALSANEVLTVLDGLGLAGVPAWLAGGWGIDALLGRRTRSHGDIDLLVEARHEDAAVDALEQQGFVLSQRRAPAASNLPAVTVLRRNRQAIDVLWFLGADADWTTTTETLPRFGRASFTRGVLEGHVVGCLSPAEQFRLHRFDLDRRHRRDLRRLRAVYGDEALTGDQARY
jgi:lincosamide nucleotidyltransferase A/C/D/E